MDTMIAELLPVVAFHFESTSGQCAIDVRRSCPDSLRNLAFGRFGAQNSRLLEFSHERVLDVIGFAPDLHT